MTDASSTAEAASLLIVGTLATLLSFWMGFSSIGPIFAFLGVGA